MDHPILLGSPDTNIVNSSLDLTSRISKETLQFKETPSHPVIVSDPESLQWTPVWLSIIPFFIPGPSAS